jgi:hypothetical protein
MLNNAGINNIIKLKLNDINWTIGDIDELESLTALQETLGTNMYLAGTIHITGNWSQVKLNNYNAAFGEGNITWITNPAKEIAEYKLTFYLNRTDANNQTNAYYTTYVQPESGNINITLGEDPVQDGRCPIPTKASTESTTYYFGTSSNPANYMSWRGWEFKNSSTPPNINSDIGDNTDFIAIFGEMPRTYPLYWYLNSEDT